MADSENNFAPEATGVVLGAREIGNDVAFRLLPVGPRYRLAIAVLLAVFLAGLIAFALRQATSGLGNRSGLAYLSAAFMFLLTTSLGAPMLAIGLRFLHADWRREVDRVSRLFAAPMLLALLVYTPLLLSLPPIQGRRTYWIEWPLAAPGLYDTAAMVGVLVTGLALLYLSAIPDFAAVRDRRPGWRGDLYARLAHNWRGTRREWILLDHGLVLLGVFYAMLTACTLLLISTDFGMSLIPGYASSIFPPYNIVVALESGLAAVLIALFLGLRFGGLERYLRRDHFASAGAILFVLALLSLYHWWSEFLTFWYGRQPQEVAALNLLNFGPYFVPWVIAFLGLFLIPFAVLLWRPFRHSVLGPVLVSAGVLVGNFFDRLRVQLAAFSIENVTARELGTVPAAHLPDGLDIVMILGVLAGMVLLYLAAAKVVPPIAMGQIRVGRLLRLRRPFGATETTVIGKPG